VRLRCRRAKSAPRFRLAQHATPSFLALFSRSPKRLRCNCVLKPRARVARSSAFRPPPSLRTLAGRRFPSVGSALVDGVDSGRSRRSLCARLRKASPATGTLRCFRSGRPTSLALGKTAMKKNYHLVATVMTLKPRTLVKERSRPSGRAFTPKATLVCCRSLLSLQQPSLCFFRKALRPGVIEPRCGPS